MVLHGLLKKFETYICLWWGTEKIKLHYLGFTAHQDYFTPFEQSQSLGGAKTGDPQE